MPEHESLLQDMLAVLPGALYRYVRHRDGKDALHYISPGCQTIWERDAATLCQNVDLLWQDVVVEDLAAVQAGLKQSAITLTPWHQEWRIELPSGHQKWLQTIAHPQHQADDSVVWEGIFLDISDRKQTQQTALSSQQRLQNILASISDAFFSLDRDWCFTFLNSQAKQLLQRSEGELLGHNIWQTFPEAVDLKFYHEYHRAVVTQQAVEFEEYYSPLDVWFAVHAYPFEEGLSVFFQNITQRKRAEQALRDSEARYRLLADNTNDLVCLHQPNGRYLYVSPSCQLLLGYAPEELLDQTPYTFIHPEDRDIFRHGAHHNALAGAVPAPVVFRIRCKDGHYRWLEALTRPLSNANGEVIRLLTTSRDVSKRVQAEDKLRHDAHHDPLTGLLNRHHLLERLDLALQRSSRYGDFRFAVLFLDLDRFKVVNDSLGHQAGDEILVELAKRLQPLIRTTDIVARLSGDEFIILLEEIHSITDPIRVAERINDTMRFPFRLAEREVFLSASVGIVMADPDHHTAEQLLRDADTAMYRAKHNGKARYEIFDTGMHLQALQRLHLENDLREALIQESFELHYQPIISLSNEHIQGFEALLRWKHPEQGLISPETFIPIAEETGLIVSLGEWVLRRACRQLQYWQQRFPACSDLHISVNLSPRQLQEASLLQRCQRIIDDTGIRAKDLHLEITESLPTGAQDQVILQLQALQALGISISIDDFGTGYSSLSYLHRLPVNRIKVDRSFVKGLDSGADGQQLVSLIIGLARQLQLEVVAEGIETADQAAWLRQAGCPCGQGYYYARPMDPVQATLWLAKGDRG